MSYFVIGCFLFFKQKTAYEMRISDWSSDVCSSDLPPPSEPPLPSSPSDAPPPQAASARTARIAAPRRIILTTVVPQASLSGCQCNTSDASWKIQIKQETL